MSMASRSSKIWVSLAAKPNGFHLMRGFCSRPLLADTPIPELRVSTSKLVAKKFNIRGSTLHSAEEISMMKSEMGKMKIDQRKHYSVLQNTATKSQSGYREMDEMKAQTKENMNFSIQLEGLKEILKQYELKVQEMNRMKQFNSEMEKISKRITMLTEAQSGCEVRELIDEVKAKPEENSVEQMQFSAEEMAKEKLTSKHDITTDIINDFLYLVSYWCVGMVVLIACLFVASD